MIKILNGRTMKGVAAGAAFVGMIAFPVAAEPPLPRDVPRHAAEALALAQKWQRDAILIAVQTQKNMNFALEFGFRSPSTKGRFAATYANGRMSSEVRPPITANDGGAIPLQFLDLPAALAQARRQGLSSAVKEASLDVTGAPGRPPRLTWSIQADTDHYPYVFTVNANVGAPPANNIAVNDRTHAPAHLSALPVRIVTPSSAAEALWQKANAYYDRKDFPDALSAYMQAAQLGHPRAMAVLGNMYREGEGIPKNLGKAVSWYTQAAARGDRGAQFSLGSMYEEGEGVSKNLGKAAQLYEASARQGMPEAQFALGLSYEFGQGVSRNRRTAIYWLDQVAKQGDGRAKWYADWLSRPDTPQFRDEAAFGRYTASKVSQKVYSEMHAGDRARIGGNSPERVGNIADLEARGEYSRAATCRMGGSC